MPSDAQLIAAAAHAREFAHATYSGIKIGAALETSSGEIVCGSNIENASYNLGLCAERVAMFKALSEGHRDFVRIAIVCEGRLATPCGACRQILWEFGGNLHVVLSDLATKSAHHQLRDLFGEPFDRGSLDL